MLNFILKRKFNINGRMIECKVTGAPNYEKDNRPFILYLPGGPGYPYLTTLADEFEKRNKALGLPSSPIIYFDYVGCGSSDKPQDPVAEYTMDNFTHIAIDIVEAVKKELGLEKIDILAYGPSFGGMVALNLPKLAPDWLSENATTRLRMIYTVAAPTGKNICSLDFIRKYYENDPHCQEYLDAVEKLRDGKINEHDDNIDYIKNIATKLARAYGNQFNSPIYSFVLTLLQWQPKLTIAFMTMLSRIAPVNVGKKLEHLIVTLTGCSIDVMNQFFRTHHSNFEAEEIISSQYNLYSKIPICMIGGAYDFCAVAKLNAERLIPLLPTTLAEITFPGKHWDYTIFHTDLAHALFTGRFKEVLEKIMRENPTCGIKVNALPDIFLAQLQTYREEKFSNSLNASNVPSTLFYFPSAKQKSDELLLGANVRNGATQ